MTRRDHAVIGVLVLLLVAIGTATVLPDLSAAGPVASPTAGPAGPTTRPYREGILSRPVAVSPLSARSQADRDLVALLFSGLVRPGPAGSFVPDLAASWTASDDAATWTFRLRDDARWHDGTPVTASDVVFTIETLQDPRYVGPAAASWRDVTVTEVDPRTVRFQLATPLAGFLAAATQPIAPAHLLGAAPIERLDEQPFVRSPIGSGPFALVSLDDDEAVLAPAYTVTPAPAPSRVPTGPTAAPTDALATPAPLPPPAGPVPYLDGIDLRFFDDPAALALAYEAGELDAVSGLAPADAVGLAGSTGSEVLRYPGSTLTTVLLNLRPSQAAFRAPAVRRALLAGIDRAALIDAAYGGAAARADGPIPPGSWAFDVTASRPVPFDRAAATAALEKAGWKRLSGGWALPKAKEPLTFDVLSPDETSNPIVWRAAREVVAGWRSLGLQVHHVALPPADLAAGWLRPGSFAAAVVEVNIGLDPDLYPLLASTQATRRGLNVAGVQDPRLDRLLEAARRPGTTEERRAAYESLQARLADQQYLLPIAFRDTVVVARDGVSGRSIRQVADPADRFWDVLTWRLADAR